MFTKTKKCKLIALGLAGIFGASLFCPYLVHVVNAETTYSMDYTSIGEAMSANYSISYDSYTEKNSYQRADMSVASYSNKNNTLTNSCTAVAGTNIIGTYDRFYPNLIPNFEPGITLGSSYYYLGDVGNPAVTTVTETLYEMMDINESGAGATEQECLNGLKEYVNRQGYQISYTSVYRDTTEVDLSDIETMVMQDKVGIIFCSKYNFIDSIRHNSATKTVNIIKNNYDAAHAMMIYGYLTVQYYRNGKNFLTETYLQAASGFSSARKGYIKMDDYLQIDAAYMVNIS